MKRILVLIFAGIILSSCSNSAIKTASESKQNVIEMSNDMEHALEIIPSWINESTVVAMKTPAAHSGTYACFTNDTIEFGYGYMEQIKNITPALPKYVSVTGWAYTTVANPNLAIVLDVSQNNTSFNWMAFPLADSLTITGEWVPFTTSFYFSKPLNPEQQIKIYPWNQSKNAVYIDDLKIRFEY